MKVKTVMLAGIGIVVLAAGVGCVSTTPPYQAPTSGPMAKLHIRASIGPITQFKVVSYSNAQNCTGGELIASEETGKHGAMSAVLKAGQMATLSFRSTVGGAHCEVMASFLPRAGRSYAMVAMEQGGRCGVTIDDITAGKVAEPTYVPRAAQGVGCTVHPGLEQAMLARVSAGTTSKAPGSSLDDFKALLPGK